MPIQLRFDISFACEQKQPLQARAHGCVRRWRHLTFAPIPMALNWSAGRSGAGSRECRRCHRSAYGCHRSLC